MMHPTIDIKTFLKPGVRAHLAGIGGVSMCPLAEVLLGMGLIVQGSDMTESDTVCQLRAQGIDVAIGHSAENLKDCDLVIRTAAVHDGNTRGEGERFFQTMLRQNDRRAKLPVDLAERCQKVRRCNRVKLTCWLVENQHLRLKHHHRRKIQKLLLSAGQFCNRLIKPCLDAEK